jgi:Zn finger protein HypA/HybF involved in hydrogenase expression
MEYNKNVTNSWGKSGRKPSSIPKEEFIEVCKHNPTMARAAAELGLHFNTFKKYAEKYNCYEPNQSGKGTKKSIPRVVEKLEDYTTRKGVRDRILKDNLLEYKCNECGIKDWNGKELSLHLDHINGDRWDHRLKNLQFLCPNCHSQTENYTGKNKK